MFKLVISNSFQKMGWLAEVPDHKSILEGLQEKHQRSSAEQRAGITLETHRACTHRQ
ncbi:hypothetical protein [Massilia sp. TSP1-1-2]|uniref:hypothetical protein n=1 Tax=Massilia sp. TSP1-1-2 TaxID=2804649 RepID=UPI003CF87C50